MPTLGIQLQKVISAVCFCVVVIALEKTWTNYTLSTQGGKCETRLVHGFHFRKITVSLNEWVKPAPQVFAAEIPCQKF